LNHSTPHLDGFATQTGGRARKGVERPHPAHNGGGILLPVNSSFVLFYLVGVSDTFFGLFHWPQLPRNRQIECLHDHARAQIRHLVMQCCRSVCIQYRQTFPEQHVPGVQTRVHLHDGDTRMAVPRLNGPVNGCSATPARQQRAVDIQTAMARTSIPMRGGHVVQHPLRQDQAIGGNHHHIRVGICNRLPCGGGIFGVLAVESQATRLGHCNAMLQRKLLDARCLQLHATSRRAIRLAEHQCNGVACGVQPFQRNPGKLGRAGKNDSQSLHLARFLAQCLEHFGFDAVALERRQVFHKHLAHQVVHFMLDTHRQQLLGLNRPALAFVVQRLHVHRIKALDTIVNTGHREAAFFVDVLGRAGPDNFGIDQHQRLVAVFRHINHDDTFVHIDLGRRQANALASYMVSSMSRTRVWMRASTAATGLATLCNLGSG